MKIYRLEPREADEPCVEARRTWNLPGVQCTACGETWANIGLDYPSLDLSTFPMEGDYRKARCVELSEYDQMKRDLLAWLPRKVLVRPGAGFGSLKGEVQGDVGNLVWPNWWTVVFRERLVAQLTAHGIRGLSGRRFEVTGLRSGDGQLVEIELSPRAVLHHSVIPADIPPPCNACGRWAIVVPDDVVINRESVPKDVELFRGYECTTVVFATERLVEALSGTGVNEFTFEEVQVAS